MPDLHKRVYSFLKGNQGYYAFLKYNSIRKLVNLVLAECQKTMRSPHLHSYPYKMILDITNMCNLSCLHCPTGKGIRGREKGLLKFEDFRNIIDEVGRYVYIVDLFNWGEPLLNKEIYKMVDYAERSNICTNIHTNFNVEFDEESARQMIDSGLSYLSVSLDGADQGVYSIYRRKGDFEKALKNLRFLIKAKENFAGKKTPFITWQFLVFSHNRHQVELARRMADELGINCFKVLGGVTSGGLSGVKRGKEEGASKMKDMERAKCDWLWTTATFHWDGGVGPCCLQFKEEDDFGSVRGDAYRTVWNNGKFTYARKLFGRVKTKVELDNAVICTNCFKAKTGN
jgi:organic radical activating enzyme